jgi:hypothetical protein
MDDYDDDVECNKNLYDLIKMDEYYTYQDLYSFFKNYSNLYSYARNISEFIFEIYEATDIDWKEISSEEIIPNFILDNFKHKLDWVILFFNNEVFESKRKLHKYRDTLFMATKTDGFLNNLDYENNKHVFIIDRILNVNQEIAYDVYMHICRNGYFLFVKHITHDKRINDSIIIDGFIQACKEDRIDIVEYLANVRIKTSDSPKPKFRKIIDEPVIEKGIEVASQHHATQVLSFLNNKSINI